MEKAEAVFLGVVIDADGTYPIPASDSTFRSSGRWFQVRVLASWKGADEETLVVATGSGEGDCGYNFRLGDVYLIYAGGRVHGDTVSTSICSRTRPISDAREDSLALGAPRVDRTGRRPWLSFGPPAYCPVHPSYAIRDGMARIVFGLTPAMAREFRAAQAARFPFAGMQIDRPRWDVGDRATSGAMRGVNHAAMCDLCRARAEEWLGHHGDSMYRDFLPDSGLRHHEPSLARYESRYPMKRFAFLIDNGVNLKYDSIEGTLRRRVPGQRDSTVHLELGAAELRRIYERMVEIRFFDIPSSHPTYFVPDSIRRVGAHAQVSLFARSDTTVQQLIWDDAYAVDRERMVPEWRKLYGLVDLIHSILAARPEYLALYGKKN